MKWVGAIVVVLVAGASVATRPPQVENPRAMLVGAQIDARVRGLFERACRDCHSEQTRFPWYSYIAPVSWLVRKDVLEGREHLNLSRWHEYPTVRKERSLSEIANQVRDRDMPLPNYVRLHGDARLSDEEVEAIFQWTQTERTRLILTR